MCSLYFAVVGWLAPGTWCVSNKITGLFLFFFLGWGEDGAKPYAFESVAVVVFWQGICRRSEVASFPA